MSTAKAKRRHPFIRLLNYASVYKRRVALATVYSVLGKLFDIMPPVLIGMAVDIVVQRQDSLLGRLGVRDLSAQLIIPGHCHADRLDAGIGLRLHPAHLLA